MIDDRLIVKSRYCWKSYIFLKIAFKSIFCALKYSKRNGDIFDIILSTDGIKFVIRDYVVNKEITEGSCTLYGDYICGIEDDIVISVPAEDIVKLCKLSKEKEKFIKLDFHTHCINEVPVCRTLSVSGVSKFNQVRYTNMLLGVSVLPTEGTVNNYKI